MPRQPMDYSKTIIYKIVCNDLTVSDCYAGHTTNFIKRKNNHKNNCNNENSKKYNLKIYTTIRANGGWTNWQMIEVQKFPCLDIYEATARERYWYELLNAKMNTYVPSRGHKEYYYENKQQILEYQKEYKQANKEQILEKKKEYYYENKQQILEKQKEYYYENKEQLIEYQKDYYEKNKKEINEKSRVKRLTK